MAVRFEQNEQGVQLVQTRRGLRWLAVALVVMSVLGLGMMALLHTVRTDTTLTCDHASGSCTLEEGRRTRAMTLASITSAEVRDDSAAGRHDVWVELLRSEMPRYQQLCGAREAADAEVTRAFGAQLAAFLASPTAPPITLHCVAQEVNGPSPAVFPFALLGWVILFLMASPFSHEVTTILDRRAGTIEVKGRGWLRRAWSVKRPLSDVARIEIRTRYAGYGSRQYMVFAVFHDGTSALLWSPAAVMPKTVDDRVAAMRAALHPS